MRQYWRAYWIELRVRCSNSRFLLTKTHTHRSVCLLSRAQIRRLMTLSWVDVGLARAAAQRQMNNWTCCVSVVRSDWSDILPQWWWVSRRLTSIRCQAAWRAFVPINLVCGRQYVRGGRPSTVCSRCSSSTCSSGAVAHILSTVKCTPIGRLSIKHCSLNVIQLHCLWCNSMSGGQWPHSVHNKCTPSVNKWQWPWHKPRLLRFQFGVNADTN